MLSERLGRWTFWLLFVGFNVTFFPMHLLGLRGMTRRIYTYGADTGWQDLNLLSSAGAALLALSLVLMLVNCIRSARHGARAGDNPWSAGTLEWATPSPPPPYNFVRPPVVTSAEPLWEPAAGAVTGLPTDVRSTLVTRVQDAAPDHVEILVTPSLAPFVAAVATSVMFVASIFTPWAVIWGSIPIGAALIYWFWPRAQETAKHVAHEVKPADDLAGNAA
jgi:cytochrome c oxidase subunit 1